MRYLVTGGSGYLGRRLVAALSKRPDAERVAAADVTARELPAEVDYQTLDVRDPGAAQMVIGHEGPDVLVHMAAIVDPAADSNAVRDVNVGGTNNVLTAAASANVPHVIVVSSVAGYGPVDGGDSLVDETAPMRGDPGFDYARDAANADRLAQLWSARHTDRVTTIVRPCLVLGPSADNAVVRLWTQKPFAGRVAPAERQVQFLHEDDMASALLTLIDRRQAGVFNLAGEGRVSLAECAELAGLKRPKLAALRSKDSALGFLDNARLVDTSRISDITGWSPEHTSRAAFEAALRAHGRLSSARAAMAATATPVSAPQNA